MRNEMGRQAYDFTEISRNIQKDNWMQITYTYINISTAVMEIFKSGYQQDRFQDYFDLSAICFIGKVRNIIVS